MPAYKFTNLPASRPVSVYAAVDPDVPFGAAVSTGTTDANGVYYATLPSGDYIAEARDPRNYYPTRTSEELVSEFDPETAGTAIPSPGVPGVSVRLTTLAGRTTLETYPNMRIVSLGASWSDLEPTQGALSMGAATVDVGGHLMSEADATLHLCHTTGQRVILRPFAGVSAPIGKPGAVQASWLAALPGIQRVRRLNADGNVSLLKDEVYVPRPNTAYLTAVETLVEFMAAWLDGPCPSGEAGCKRSAHVVCVSAFAPTENGSEETRKAGTLPAFWGGNGTTAGAAATVTSQYAATGVGVTLSNAPGTSGETFELSGVIPSTGNGAWAAIGTQGLYHVTRAGVELELVQGTRTDADTLVVTGKRGWSGTTAADLQVGDVVRYAGLSSTGAVTTSGTAASPMTFATLGDGSPFDGLSGIFSKYHVNKAADRYSYGVSTDAAAVTAIQAEYASAWTSHLHSMMRLLPDDVRVCYVGGDIEGNNWSDAYTRIRLMGRAYGKRIIALTTDLDQSWLSDQGYSWQFITRWALGSGAAIATQTRGTGFLTAIQDLVTACEDFLSVVADPVFIETNPERASSATSTATTAYKGWVGGTLTQLAYLTYTAQGTAVQQRLDPRRRTPVLHGIGHLAVVVKSADETVNNSAVVQIDDHLQFLAEAGAVYVVEGYLIYDTGTTPDFKVSLDGPTDATFAYTIEGVTASAASAFSAASHAVNARAVAVSMGGLGAGTPMGAKFHGIVRTVLSGTVSVKWAQNTADVSDTKVLTNSYLSYRRIA